MLQDKIKNFLPSFLYKLIKKTFHIFRFYNLVKPNYTTSNKIVFGSLEAGEFLKKKITGAKCFLEFGSGNTTIFAQEKKIKFFSIESDRNFFFYMKCKKKINNISFQSLGYVEFYSYPLFRSNFFKFYYKKRAKSYASDIFNKFNQNSIYPDLILVDGRYRVLCMLNIFKFLKKNNFFSTCVILDDLKNRAHYKIINDFFNVSYLGRLGVCHIKDNIQSERVDDLIENYAYDPR